MSSTIDWNRFCEIVRGHQRFLLTSHIRPDCDSLGSQLGMARILDTLGKDVRIVDGQDVPPMFRFLDPEGRIKTIHQSTKVADLQDVEILMVLDTSAWIQLGDMADVVRESKAKKLIVDHHVSQDDLGAELFKDTNCEATGRLVLEAADRLGVPLTKEIAQPLFAAVATDTGWFRFASTKPATYEAASRFLQAGVQPHIIYSKLYEQDTLARLKLVGRVLGRSQTEFDGRLIYTSVLREDFDETGAIASDTEDVINLTLNVAGTEVAVIWVSLLNGNYKVSFRSRCGIDCSQLAGNFKGGGHKAAAGATLPGPLEDAQKRVLDVVRAAMKQ